MDDHELLVKLLHDARKTRERAKKRWDERRAAGIPIGGPDERKKKKKPALPSGKRGQR